VGAVMPGPFRMVDDLRAFLDAVPFSGLVGAVPGHPQDLRPVFACDEFVAVDAAVVEPARVAHHLGAGEVADREQVRVVVVPGPLEELRERVVAGHPRVDDVSAGVGRDPPQGFEVRRVPVVVVVEERDPLGGDLREPGCSSERCAAMLPVFLDDELPGRVGLGGDRRERLPQQLPPRLPHRRDDDGYVGQDHAHAPRR
jgi:hypothetical protein